MSYHGQITKPGDEFNRDTEYFCGKCERSHTTTFGGCDGLRTPYPPPGAMLEPIKSDGSTARYYELPAGAQELQDLIAFRDMNAQLGEIFRACYRYGLVSHSPKIRDIKKIIFYAQAELARLEKYERQEGAE